MEGLGEAVAWSLALLLSFFLAWVVWGGFAMWLLRDKEERK